MELRDARFDQSFEIWIGDEGEGKIKNFKSGWAEGGEITVEEDGV